ncbi:MAG: family 10 glycosylhydrolase [Bacteroidota bacterium]|nr:family 10 glycosylhydrolase [Bacteroidota bacterium]
MNRKIFNSIISMVILLFGIGSFGYTQTYPKHEMRAVWIATVENIDWPSAKGLSTDQQKQEMIELLDQVVAYNMNTVVFQIRPDADALYNSELEPWSEWLSGTQGTPPDPYYDPLEFTISECRKRGLDVHVWLNPYRAIQNVEKTVAAPNQVANTHPEWMLTYGNKKYFDPGIPEVRNHVARVVSDLVRRYDIDAIHFDDYFYPYRVANQEFPDQNSFAAFPNGFASDKKDNWRRNNVDLIIKQLHDSIKSIKSNVEFGISPFGVWKNNTTDPAGSATKAGVTNYDDLYADILLWQKEGWIDYVTPQLYWYIGKTVADYAILTDWWSKNTYGCPLYIGQAPFLIRANASDTAWQTSDELIRQIKLNRSYPNIGGSMFFSAKSLKQNPLGVKEKLLQEFFKYPALTPHNPRVEPVKPAIPEKASIKKKHRAFELTWEKAENNRMFVVYKCSKKSNLNIENPENILKVSSETSMVIKKNRKTNTRRYNYAVTAISPTHNESEPVVFKSK